eukprot:m.170801 g.170801  ORF g.170801 m.170801 type:complete len:393 (-) comp16489_c1_seq1:64-1242(-)
MYYWDMFWIVRGLIQSNMFNTTKNIINNYYSLIDRFGFIPNGARIYYLTRSQPPVLSEIVMALYEATGNETLLSEAYPYLAKEYAYWNGTHTDNHKSIAIGIGPSAGWLTRYYAETTSPRPESFREDQATANQAGFDREEQEQFFRDVATGAETGWDFSSRWLKTADALSTIRTTEIVPVDLNCFMLRFERHLAIVAKQAGDTTASTVYSLAADARARVMMASMYNETTGRFHDLLLPLGTQIPGRVTPAAYFPLWAEVSASKKVQLSLMGSFLNSQLLQVAAVDTTNTATGQQWDKPNAWAPLQWILAEGFDRVGNHALANAIRCRWLETTMLAFKATGYMYEKYDAYALGKGGGGGEYVPQLGFGWTNGVVLDFAAHLASDYDTICNHHI